MTTQPESSPEWIRVRAVPALDMWLIDCNLCGVVGMVPDQDSDEASLQHLEEHNVDTTFYRSTL